MESDNEKIKKRDEELPGYPSNPPSEDAYEKLDKEDVIENLQDPYEPNPAEQATDEFIEDPTLGDLDVPGSELDDDMEIIGNEDEENNYYSLGGDEKN